ncbi:DUF2306 domain-containing protein [Kutzneria sp. CA-103260]|uniref:DUF2306 domain-containing protein n=1 Tax=Kutzneria sp. CA-103260 TaxID=2802641 RepID=UPI001BEFE222|nr:DUF2306 domain-containing protein [Kutzneria sp. CA-103260]QUQ65489.1 hypothetical protein JJ691_32120 [Kutzneria sp. CA-103260]
MSRTRSGRDDLAMTSSTKRIWPLPTGLILLSTIPVLAGGLRIGQLSTGAQITAENARFFADPVPVVVHVISVTVFCVLGAFQFSTGFRVRWPRWHRVAGRIVAPCGVAAALSGLWMTVYYPRPPGVGDLLTGFRLVFGTAMAVSLVLGFAAVLRRDIARHRAWMTRGYAIGIGAGTQAVTQLPVVLVIGPLNELTTALMMLGAWLLNLAIAEWFLRRRSPGVRPARRGSTATAART